MDSLGDYCTLELWLMKEYNTQVWFSTWGMDVGLTNHVKNKFANYFPYLFTLNTLIILLFIVFFWINLYYLLILLIYLIHPSS